MFKVNDKKHQNDVTMFFQCFYCYLRTYFTAFSSVSNVELEQISATQLQIFYFQIANVLLHFSFWIWLMWLDLEWTGFYMITASVMKESSIPLRLTQHFSLGSALAGLPVRKFLRLSGLISPHFFPSSWCKLSIKIN